jgi:hypothetical protein
MWSQQQYFVPVTDKIGPNPWPVYEKYYYNKGRIKKDVRLELPKNATHFKGSPDYTLINLGYWV